MLAIDNALVIGAFIVYPKVQTSIQVDTEAKNLGTKIVKPTYGTLNVDSLTTQCKTKGNNNTLVFISL